MTKIDFLLAEDYGLGAVKPIPAVKEIPQWYKKMPPLRRLFNKNNPEEKKDFTIKKCIPVLDAFTTGYYLVTEYESVWSFTPEGEHSCTCPATLVEGGSKPITMHPFEQIRDIDLGGLYNEYAYKFSNPYVIKTPPGYSCIFTHPFNQISPFLTLTGVVDTDMHPLAVQFPFLMLKGWEGSIKPGTPIVQIIPFKREDWAMEEIEATVEDRTNSEIAQKEFSDSRYDPESGEVSGGEYKKKHRVNKKYF
jgi:hypothetical protein